MMQTKMVLDATREREEADRRWQEQQAAEQRHWQEEQAERQRQWRNEDIRRTRWDIAVKVIGPVVGAVLGAVLGGAIAWFLKS